MTERLRVTGAGAYRAARSRRTLRNPAPMPSEQAQLDELSTILHYPFGCAALKAAHDACRRRAGWQECAAASDALDACVEAGERRKFRAEKDCGTLKRRWHACFLNREPSALPRVLVCDEMRRQ